MKTILYADPNPMWTQKDILFEKKPEGFDLVYLDAKNRDAFVSAMPDADYLITGWQAGKIDGDLLSKAKKLKFIQIMGAGYENVDVEAAKKLRIPISNTAGINAVSVSEHVLMFILAFYKRFYAANAALQQGTWPYSALQQEGIEEVRGKIVGLIGYGNVGKEIAHRLSAFDMKILYNDLYRSPQDEKLYGMKYAAIQEILPVCDVLILQVPLTDSTRNLIGPQELKSIKKGALLINAARGGIVDENALADAVSSGHLAGACIDCFESEPLESGSPLRGVRNIYLTPHIAGATNHIFEKSILLAYENIQRVESNQQPKKMIWKMSEP